jgi:hypothetical protein
VSDVLMGGWKDGQWQGLDPTVEDLVDEDRECSCCRFLNPPGGLQVYGLGAASRHREHARNNNEPPFKALCPICARTMVGSYADYPDQHRGDELELMRMIAFCTNTILARLEGR